MAYPDTLGTFDEEGAGTTQTTFGSDKAPYCCVAINSKTGTPSALVLKNAAGKEAFIWLDGTGDVVVGTRAEFIANTSGGEVVVGAQS